MSVPINKLLARLDGVKQTGPGRWIAKCPTRRDRNPSLNIRELPDGRLLVHDFGGDPVDEVLAAIGLDIADLFPDRPLVDGRRPERRPFAAEDALRCLAFEAQIVLTAAHDLRMGRKLTDCEIERLGEAIENIKDAMEACNV